MKKKLKFKVGDWVRVRACLWFKYDHLQYRVAEPMNLVPKAEETPRGQVTGATFVPMGKRILSRGEDSPTEFKPSGSIFVYLVRLGATNAELRVREEDLEACDPLPNGLPLRFAVYPAWSEVAREEVRREARAMRRDERGRFKPVGGA
jgi:hypothetical protein